MKVLLIVYDNGSHINWFPQGISYLVSYLKTEHEVTIYNQDIYHYPESHLTNYLDNNNFDVVCLGIIGGYYQYKKMLKISKAIRAAKRNHLYILGGHGPSPEPEYFLNVSNADYVVIGEGEETILDLLQYHGTNKIKYVRGIAFFEDGKFIQTPPSPLNKNVDEIMLPSWDDFPIEHYVLSTSKPSVQGIHRMLPMISGRGCPFTCNFCYRIEKGFRARSTESILEEVKILKNKFNVTMIDFTDDLLMSSEKRTIEICEALVDQDIKWVCNGRLNYVTKELISLMKKAGCVYINYGIESIDDTALKLMNKKLTVEQIIKGIEATLDVGVTPGLNIIFGNLGENKHILKKDVEFLKKYSDGKELRTIRPVTPYPGSPLYYKAIEDGKLEGPKDFYENKHLNSDLLAVNFTDMSDDEFYKELCGANLELINDYYHKNRNQCIDSAIDLYKNKNVNFRGFRTV